MNDMAVAQSIADLEAAVVRVEHALSGIAPKESDSTPPSPLSVMDSVTSVPLVPLEKNIAGDCGFKVLRFAQPVRQEWGECRRRYRCPSPSPSRSESPGRTRSLQKSMHIRSHRRSLSPGPGAYSPDAHCMSGKSKYPHTYPCSRHSSPAFSNRVARLGHI